MAKKSEVWFFDHFSIYEDRSRFAGFRGLSSTDQSEIR